MSEFTSRSKIVVLVLKWLAKLLSLLIIGVLLIFFVSDPPKGLKLETLVLLVFFPFGIIIGTVVGLWKQGLGGAIVVLSLLAFYALHALLNSGRLPGGWAFVVFAVPGIPFLLHWLLVRTRRRAV